MVNERLTNEIQYEKDFKSQRDVITAVQKKL